MRNPLNTTANDCYRDTPAVGLHFEKDFVPIVKSKSTRGVGWRHGRRFRSEAEECFHIAFANRHSEYQMDLRLSQESFGDENSETTEVYTNESMKNLSNIKEPTDDLNFEIQTTNTYYCESVRYRVRVVK